MRAGVYRRREGAAVKLSDIKPGDRLRCDDGFTCIPANAIRIVRRAANGDLAIRCRGAEGAEEWQDHCLDGQVGDDGELIGVGWV